jgi:transposase-like protein
MSMNGSGVRDTARALQMSTATVIQELKKRGRPSRRYILPSSIACIRAPWQ